MKLIRVPYLSLRKLYAAFAAGDDVLSLCSIALINTDYIRSVFTISGSEVPVTTIDVTYGSESKCFYTPLGIDEVWAMMPEGQRG